MNPLINPLISIPLIKDFIFDKGRINRLNNMQLKKFRNKEFRKIVKYAYNVPLYHKKYKKIGIYPNDINNIEQITKLPLITKKDLVDNFPDNIRSIYHKKEKSYLISTGGTTGKPLSIYTDFQTMAKGAIITIREMNHFNLNWRKTRFAHIGNFNKYRIDLISQEKFQSHLKPFISLKNHLNLDVNLPIIKIIKKLNEFKPELIMTYPAIFQHLAYLKRKGFGKNIKPKILWTGGAILDSYTRNYVEDAFSCKLLNIYPSVEAGSDIAFECEYGKWHIHTDFFNLEAIDFNNELIKNDDRGHIVLTRLWGKGTPIIRYTGMDDWIKLSSKIKCNCGLETPTIIGGVEGRSRANIVLPDGKIFPPGAFCFITPILNKLKTFKIKQYQIIQKKIDEIEILIVIDEDLRDIGASVKVIIEKIKDIYQKKVGPKVIINVKEVNKIENKNQNNKPPPIVVSNVKLEEGFEIIENKK